VSCLLVCDEVSVIEASVRMPGDVSTTVGRLGTSAMVVRAGPTAVVIFTKHASLITVMLTSRGVTTV